MRVALGRRNFLKATSGFLLGVGLARFPRSAGATSAPSRVAATLDHWDELAGALEGQLLRPGDPDFVRIASPWNLRFASILPAGIARCVSAEDVRTCLLWSQANGVPIVARSGGHSYAGYSTTTGLMIDVSQMNQVRYDAATGIARLGGGARNANVYASLRRVGRAVTHGRCFGVGVAGLVLGGGIGFNQRRHGLTCDQLVETEVVTASGEILRCNERDHADLFWACRGGGGGNFGINTSFTFQTFPVDSITVYQIEWTNDVDALLPAALDLLPATPDRLGAKLSVVNHGDGLSIELLGQLEGSAAELRTILNPLYRIAEPSAEMVRTVPYWEGQNLISEEGTPGYSHERSRYVYEPMSAEGAATILDYLRRWPGTGGEATWKCFLTGGAIAAVPRDATAYVHREAQWLSSIELDWTAEDSVGNVARNEEWLDEFHQAMRPYTSDESYQNFIDPAQTDYLRAYYGDNLEWLVQVKRRYDPQNVFKFPQGIPLALGTPPAQSEPAVPVLTGK